MNQTNQNTTTKNFLTPDFLLQNKISKILYHDYAKSMPIIDYHNHISPKIISDNKPFSSINSAWLDEDHYKWRVMRALGINENEITGDAPEKLKFKRWAQAVPYTVRNPLFHWTHLELKRYFNINTLLQPSTADKIFYQTNELISKMEPVEMLKKFNVKTLCTTDDPADDLEFHIKLLKNEKSLKVLPGFRPDNVLNICDENYIEYINKLGSIDDTKIDIMFSRDADSMISEREIEFINNVLQRVKKTIHRNMDPS